MKVCFVLFGTSRTHLTGEPDCPRHVHWVVASRRHQVDLNLFLHSLEVAYTTTSEPNRQKVGGQSSVWLGLGPGQSPCWLGS